jgi:shikimate dehydrogenase
MRPITPKIFGILGSNISYSLSPRIFRILFDKYNLPHGYFTFDHASRDLPRFVESVRTLGVSAFSVTVPHKCDITQHLDSLHRSAVGCHSVNLVINRKGRLTGHNTDIVGIQKVFADAGVVSFSDLNILIVGAGGTARTALKFFLSKRAKDITIINRSRKRLRIMLSEFSLPADGGWIRAYQKTGLNTKLKGMEWDLVFNATPVATSKLLPKSILQHKLLVFEAAYAGQSMATPRSRAVIGGIDMLLYQALRGFEIMTGCKIEDYKKEKSALKRKLRRFLA